MPKEELVEFDGQIVELLPEGRFRVRLENDHEILAYTAGRMKKNRIRSMVGDRVTWPPSSCSAGRCREPAAWRCVSFSSGRASRAGGSGPPST